MYRLLEKRPASPKKADARQEHPQTKRPLKKGMTGRDSLQ
jgi:hypothetical protein